MKKKIDKVLLLAAGCAGEKSQIECLVFYTNIDLARAYLHRKKITILNEYLFIKAFLVSVTDEEMFELAKLSYIKHLSSNSQAFALIDVSRKILGTDRLGLSGKGITIAYIDTGIHSHLDFKLIRDRVVFFKDFISDKNSMYDDNGHGTFVTGVGSGSGYLSGGKFSGIAPCSNIISLKALDKRGEAGSEKILDAMQWVYDNHKKFNIRVVCMSFGSEPLGINDPMMKGAEALWKEGVVVVAAAGNSGPEYETIKSPGVSPYILTVGGFDDARFEDGGFDRKNFKIANFSSRGPAFRRYKPDIVAPSVNINSCGIKESYVKLSGTSVATPMIAGMSALLLERNSWLSPNDVKRILISSASAITHNRNLEGYGFPNIRRALHSTLL